MRRPRLTPDGGKCDFRMLEAEVDQRGSEVLLETCEREGREIADAQGCVQIVVVLAFGVFLLDADPCLSTIGESLYYARITRGVMPSESRGRQLGQRREGHCGVR